MILEDTKGICGPRKLLRLIIMSLTDCKTVVITGGRIQGNKHGKTFMTIRWNIDNVHNGGNSAPT